MKKYPAIFLLLTALLFIVADVHGQTKTITLLKENIRQSRSSAEKKAALFSLCELGYTLHPDTLMAYAKTAETLAAADTDNRSKIKTLYYQSYALTNKGLIDSSLHVAERCLQMMEASAVNDGILTCNIYNQQGRCYMRKNQYKEAVEMGYKVIAGAEKNRDTLLQVKGKTLIGWAYLKMGQSKDALTWHLKAYRTSHDTTLLEKYAILFANLALNYNALGKTDSGFYFINKAVYYARSNENLFALSNSLAIKAELLVKSAQPKLAEEPLKEVVAIRKLIGDPFYIVSDMSQLALYYAHYGQPQKGIDLCKEGIAIATQYNISTKLFFLYSSLAENYKAAGNTAEYARVLEKIIGLKDSVYQINSVEALAEMQTRYETQKQETVIAEQKLDLLKHSYLLYGSFTFIAAALLAAVFLFKNYQSRQKIKLQVIIEKEKRLNEIAILEAEENERKRIAADLHDNLGVQTNAILYNTELLLQSNAPKERLAHELHGIAKGMMVSLRETIWAMKQQDFSPADIWLRIINFCKQVGPYYAGVQIRIKGSQKSTARFTSTNALHIVLIVQEAINNSLQHARATNITAECTTTANLWLIKVQDDGKGFLLEEALEKQDHYGLHNMRSRAQQAGLFLEIISTPNKGTMITLHIPLQV